jgi:hypothetical protein
VSLRPHVGSGHRWTGLDRPGWLASFRCGQHLCLQDVVKSAAMQAADTAITAASVLELQQQQQLQQHVTDGTLTPPAGTPSTAAELLSSMMAPLAPSSGHDGRAATDTPASPPMRGAVGAGPPPPLPLPPLGGRPSPLALALGRPATGDHAELGTPGAGRPGLSVADACSWVP